MGWDSLALLRRHRQRQTPLASFASMTIQEIARMTRITIAVGTEPITIEGPEFTLANVDEIKHARSRRMPLHFVC